MIICNDDDKHLLSFLLVNSMNLFWMIIIELRMHIFCEFIFKLNNQTAAICIFMSVNIQEQT